MKTNPAIGRASAASRRLLKFARAIAERAALGLTLTIASLAVAIGPALAQPKPTTLHLSNILANEHPSGIASQEFAKAVAERTQGAVTIKVYPSGQLAGLREGVEGMRLGTIDMAWTESGTVSASVPALGYFSLPFLFTDFDQAVRAMEKLRPTVSAVIRDKMGAEMLSWSPNGFRVIVTKDRAIHSAADMKGLKMRVPEIPLYVNTFRLLQTNATPLPWGELYTAMQTGIVDGLEGPSGAIEVSKFQEVATDLSRTNHILTDFMLLANRKKLESLSKEHQAIIREEAVKLDQRFQAMSRTFDDAAYAKLKAKLKSVDNPDSESFRTVAKPVWDGFLKANPDAKAWIEIIAATK